MSGENLATALDDDVASLLAGLDGPDNSQVQYIPTYFTTFLTTKTSVFRSKTSQFSPFSLFLALLGLFSVFLDPLGAKIPGMDGESSFSHGRAGQGQKSKGEERPSLQGGVFIPAKTIVCLFVKISCS